MRCADTSSVDVQVRFNITFEETAHLMAVFKTVVPRGVSYLFRNLRMREMTVSVPIATVPHCAYQHPYNLL
jgi:hypothetical protein